MNALAARTPLEDSSGGETTRVDELARLRERIARIERTTRTGSDVRLLPAPAGIADALGGGLKAGAAYALDRSMPLLAAMLAGPSRAGTWCAVVGMPELGIEHALEAGIDPERLVLVPHPGERWLGVTAALAEVIGVIALRPGGRVRDGEAVRLAARLRERETVLLAQGDWPGAEAAIAVESMTWTGLGDGHGYLDRGRMTVSVRSRRAAARPTLAAVG
ncbi:MAG: hypothetical protein J7480_00895 [Microbacteriaceae bacterium]|nr:hypothetical protein [Microbacteriaceae bacterium]